MRIGTKGDQVRTFIAGISGRAITGPTEPVIATPRGSSGRRKR
jgi:hypothetical protein